MGGSSISGWTVFMGRENRLTKLLTNDHTGAMGQMTEKSVR